MDLGLLILSVVIVTCTAVNIGVMRYFFKRVADKITFLQDVTSTTTTAIPTEPKTLGTNPLFRVPQDKPAANTVMEADENDIEFNEQTFNSLPADLKIDIEGGDTQTPPGFEEKKEAKK